MPKLTTNEAVMITIYDLGPSKFPEAFGCSPHVRRIIFALNYKQLPFKVFIIASSTVDSVAKSVGAPPTATKPDGSPKYTVPFIHDSATGRSISDSFLIGEYLDEAYPHTPKLVPEGTRVLQTVLIDTFNAKLQLLLPVFVPSFCRFLSPELRERIETLKGPLPDLLPAHEQKEVWEKARKGVEELLSDAAYGQSGSVFVGGEKPDFADFALAASLATFKVMNGEDSDEWRNVSGWSKGRIGRLVEEILRHEGV
ncbi:hypothetical protein E1B28_013120 [Marasmius oreades]|uniref:GST N-terminal domain-containing protein n=1 Tax=Marasmius oreades TaxID=181124 RepID=A0A9P7UMN3_9AGAR|nr:uncharacterized protein E1B28_013120 [Marasmius oreades]KAG7087140.1 hypothetical protein E1B28_013120 [Marasmius oreades]